MDRFSEDDRIRVDIPDEMDPDHRYHGEHATIVRKIADDAEDLTGDSRDSQIYRVQLDSGQTIDLRWRDIRPPIEE